MDNVIEVFDAKVTIRSTLHTLASIKELLCKSRNERRNTIFRSTQFGKRLDFPSFANDNNLLNYIFEHQVKQEQNNNDCSPITYKIGDNTFDFGRQEFCLITSFLSAYLCSALSDEDAVKVCLLRVVTIVFMDREPKNYIVDNLLKLVDNLPTWDAYPWGEYIWKAFYRRNVNVICRHHAAVMTKNQKNASIRKKKKKCPTSKKNETYNVYGFVWSLKIYILEMYTNSKYWWNKDPLVIPRGLSWSKMGNFEKRDYGTLFAEWYNPILSMASTSNELLHPWFICSMEYFGSYDVEHEPPLIGHDVEHERQLLLQGQPVGENLVLVAEHHAIKERVQIIENVADVDPSIVLQQLAVVKERIIGTETFIKYKNEFVPEDSVAKHKQFVHKENESADGKMAESAISCVLIGEVFGAKSVSNEFVLQQLKSRDGKLPESEIINVLIGEASCDKFVPAYCNGQSSKLTQRQDIHLVDVVVDNWGPIVESRMMLLKEEMYENAIAPFVGQLLRKTYKGKALVEPYTIQPPTTASVHLGKAIRKRKKKAAKRLQSRKTRILFDADGDDDHDVMFISLEDWKNQPHPCGDKPGAPHGGANHKNRRPLRLQNQTRRTLGWWSTGEFSGRGVERDWDVVNDGTWHGGWWLGFGGISDELVEDGTELWWCRGSAERLLVAVSGWLVEEQEVVRLVDQEMALYLNEVNVINKNEPPSPVKVVGQLLQNTYKGKALVEPYTVQPPTTASVHLGKAIRKRKKKAAKRLQSRKTRILFDADGDDDHDVMFISLEDWENTQTNKTRKRKDAIPLSQFAKSEFSLVDYCKDLSRPPYSRRNKVKLLEFIDQVYAIGDETTHFLAWGKYDIEVDRSFWLTLLGLNHGGWLLDKTWNRSNVITLYDSMGVFVKETREWWSDMRKTRIPQYLHDWGILEAKCVTPPKSHQRSGIPLGVLLHMVWGLRLGCGDDGTWHGGGGGFGGDSDEVVRMARAVVVSWVAAAVADVPLQGDAYGECGVWVCINLYCLIHKMSLSAKDPQKVGLAYREHMFDYFWKYKIVSLSTAETFSNAGIVKSGIDTQPVTELSDWASAKVYDRMLKSAKWTVKGIDHLQLYQVCNTKEVHKVDLLKFKCTCRKWQLSRIPCAGQFVLFEHLSQEARLDEERLQNGRIYMDWIDYEATEPDQGNIQQSQQESSMNYHSFHLDDL
ncbi:hypothetical protein Tco_0039821 [Tanacetum coccineum]